MRRIAKIVWGTVVTVATTIYLVVALVNYSLVQSYIGAAASRYFTQMWGGKVHIAAINVSPLGHIKLYGIELISPTQDTICEGEKIVCRFNRMPIDDAGLHFSEVELHNVYYHLGIDTSGINLMYIINSFGPSEKSTEPSAPFGVRVGRVTLDNVHYKMDLPNDNEYHGHGVNIPHMDYQRVDADISQVCVIGDSVRCRIHHFYAKERSGFCLRHLGGDVVVSRHKIGIKQLDLETDNTHLKGEAGLAFNGWEAMSDYCNTVQHHLKLEQGTVLSMRDAAYWAPPLYDMDERIQVDGLFHGTIADMHAEGINIRFGESTTMLFDGTITGLPNIETTQIDANVHSMHTTYKDLAAVRHPDGIKMIAPEIIEKMNSIDISAVFIGSFDECYANLSLKCDIGDLMIDARYQADSQNMGHSANIVMHSDQLNVIAVMDNEWVTHGGMDIDITARCGQTPSLDNLAAQGVIELNHCVIRDNPISNTTVDFNIAKKNITLLAQLTDTLIEATLKGQCRIDEGKTGAKIDLDLDHCHLTQLLNPKDTDTFNLSTHFDADLVIGDKMQINGTASLANTTIETGKDTVRVSRCDISMSDTQQYKTIKIGNDVFDLNIDGYIEYDEIATLWGQFQQRYVPRYFQPPMVQDSSGILPLSAFNLHIFIKDNSEIIKHYVPDLLVTPNTFFALSYNATESFKIVLHSDSIGYGDIRLNNVGLEGGLCGDKYMVKIDAITLSMPSMPAIENPMVQIHLGSEKSVCRISASNTKNNDISIELNSDRQRNRITFSDPTFDIEGQEWKIECREPIIYAYDTLIVPKLGIVVGEQQGEVTMFSANSEQDSIKLSFDNFDIDMLNLLISNEALKLEGNVKGKFLLKGMSSTPYFIANLAIDNFVINRQTLGKTLLQAQLDTAYKRIKVRLLSTICEGESEKHPIAIAGHFSTDAQDSTVHTIARFDKLPLEILQPFLASFADKIEGNISGKIDLSGAWTDPIAQGALHIDKGVIGIAPTGVEYHFDDSILLRNKHIIVENFTLNDPQDNKLVINGDINFNDLKDIIIDAHLKSDNITAASIMPHENNPYGKLCLGLEGDLHTSQRGGTNLYLKATTTKGSKLTIPITSQQTIQQYSYIQFRNPMRRFNNRQKEEESYNPSNINLQVRLTITPDLQVHIPMRFSEIGANIEASGKGDALLSIGETRRPSITGDYRITNGKLILSMLDLLDKNFTIDPGSTISIPGDLANIRFDIRAVHSQRINLATLNGRSNATIPIETLITIAGMLQDPDIDFKIRIPNEVESSVAQEVLLQMDLSDQKERFNQALSLLFLGRFNNTTGSNINIDDAAAGGYNLLASTVSNLFANFVPNVDINLGYKAANSVTNSQVDISVKKDWGKVYLESTLGYGGDTRSTTNTTSPTNTFIGDLLVGYRFTPSFHSVIYNKTNTNDLDIRRIDYPYKQGIGFKFTHQFDSWDELFKKQTP